VTKGRKYQKARRVKRGAAREALMLAFGAVYIRLLKQYGTVNGHCVAEEYLAVMARPANAKKH